MTEMRKKEMGTGTSTDVFGFLTAITDTKIEGYFAVFDLGGKVMATDIYSRDTLDNLVIPDILKSHPEVYYKIFHESEFNRVVKPGIQA